MRSSSSSPSRKFPIDDVVEYYLDRPVPGGDGFVKVTCPTGEHDDRTPSATINRETGRLHCFACQFSGDAIDLVRYKEELDFASALARCEEITGQAADEFRSSASPQPGRKPPSRLRDSGGGGNRKVAGARRPPRRIVG